MTAQLSLHAQINDLIVSMEKNKAKNNLHEISRPSS